MSEPCSVGDDGSVLAKSVPGFAANESALRLNEDDKLLDVQRTGQKGEGRQIAKAIDSTLDKNVRDHSTRQFGGERTRVLGSAHAAQQTLARLVLVEPDGHRTGKILCRAMVWRMLFLKGKWGRRAPARSSKERIEHNSIDDRRI